MTSNDSMWNRHRYVVVAVLLGISTSAIFLVVYFVDADHSKDLQRVKLPPSTTITTLIVSWFGFWILIGIFRKSNLREISKLAATAILGLIIITSAYYLGIRALRTIGSGNDTISVLSYLPIKNPYHADENMTLTVNQTAQSFIAQESDISMHVRLEPNLRNETFFLVFEGSYCGINEPRKHIDIGFACIVKLLPLEDGKPYEIRTSVGYSSEGSYDLFLGTGDGADAEFTNTDADFIKIRPIEDSRAVNLDKLGVYSTILGIAVAAAAAIIAIIWTRR